MELKNFFFITSILFFTFPSLIGHIYSAELWQKGNKRCYCLKDIHTSKLKKNCVNNTNRRDVLLAAQAIKASVVIEDKEGMYREKKVVDQSGRYKVREAIQGSKELLHLYDLLIANKSMLRGTSGLFYRAGIDVDNIEFRFLSAADGEIKLKNELSYLNARAEKILNYDDKNLKPFFANTVKTYKDIVDKDGKEFFDYLAKKDKRLTPHDISSAPYIDTMDNAYKKLFPHSRPEYRGTYKKKILLLALYKSFLIDAEIARAIAQRQGQDRIIVCAGGDHILEMAPALEARGFRRIDVLASGYKDAIDLDAFFAKHEPQYAARHVKKNYINYLLDMQCYFDNHRLVALAAGITTALTLLAGVLTCPLWCGSIAAKLAPKSPRLRSVIKKTLIAAVMATTATGFYKALVPIRGSQ